LPVKLPEKVKFGKGNPLETAEEWINIKCPKCNRRARRETDTMDTFANSSWYYLRYCDTKNKKKIFDSKRVNYWCPVDQYIGGPEHVTMHLIYMRFYTKFLRDLKLLNFDEPAVNYFTQGVVKGRDGFRMSKSRGNGVEPLDTIVKYGADSLRLYLVAVSSPDSDIIWDEKGIKGSYNFLNFVYDYFSKLKEGKASPKVESKINQTIKEVTEDIENFKHNLAVIKIRQLFSVLLNNKVSKKQAKVFLILLSVYCPHLCEELWQKIGGKGFISLGKWPKSNLKKINDKFDKEDEVVNNLVFDINNIKGLVRRKFKEIFVYVLPKEEKIYLDNLKIINERIGFSVRIFNVNDKDKYDPENKSKKVKPGRPGIYLE